MTKKAGITRQSKRTGSHPLADRDCQRNGRDHQWQTLGPAGCGQGHDQERSLRYAGGPWRSFEVMIDDARTLARRQSDDGHGQMRGEIIHVLPARRQCTVPHLHSGVWRGGDRPPEINATTALSLMRSKRRVLRGGMERYAVEPERTFEKASARNRNPDVPDVAGPWPRYCACSGCGIRRGDGILGATSSPPITPWRSRCRRPTASPMPWISASPGSLMQGSSHTPSGKTASFPFFDPNKREDDVTYHLTAFATLEPSRLRSGNVRGSDWRAAYPNTGGNMQTREETEKMKDLLDAEMRGTRRGESSAACGSRRYNYRESAPLRLVPAGSVVRVRQSRPLSTGKKAFSHLQTGRRLRQLAGSKAAPCPSRRWRSDSARRRARVLEMLVAIISLLSRERAEKLAELDITVHLDACREFWRAQTGRRRGTSGVPRPPL